MQDAEAEDDAGCGRRVLGALEWKKNDLPRFRPHGRRLACVTVRREKGYRRMWSVPCTVTSWCVACVCLENQDILCVSERAGVMGSSEGNEQEHASGPERPSRSPGSNLARLELDFPEDSGSLGGREAGGGFRHWRLRHFVGGKWSICSCKAIEKRAGSKFARPRHDLRDHPNPALAQSRCCSLA